MTSISPLNVVIAGGGIAALEAMMAVRDLAEDRARITLVAPERDFELKPLRTAEPFAADHVRRYPLAPIAERFGARLRRGDLARVDADRARIVLGDGGEVAYDVLIVAVGARPRAAYDRVITFGADARTEILSGLLADLDEGYTKSVAFVVPPGISWPLPAYEIALQTAHQVFGMGIDGVELHLVTPESSPLVLFGPEPSAAVASLLDEARITFHGDAYAEVGHGRIALHPGDEEVAVERVVALPVLDGPRVGGLPATEAGFIETDDHGRVRGLDDVYAVGDCADFPIKQGGIACQQADAVAEQIAARAGAPVEPQPFRPVLRGKLLTGEGSRFLAHAIRGGGGGGRAADFSLWFPPTKVSGKYLSQWLPRLTEARVADEPEAEMEIEVPLTGGWAAGRQAMALDPYSPLR